MNYWLLVGLVINAIIWSTIGYLIVLHLTTENPLQIYIAGKYSGTPQEIEQNVANAEYWGVKVAEKCDYPVVPHLLGYLSTHDFDLANISLKSNFTYQFWIQTDNIGLEKSDGLFLISHSAGADKELELAKQLGKPIYYSIDEIPNRCK